MEQLAECGASEHEAPQLRERSMSTTASTPRIDGAAGCVPQVCRSRKVPDPQMHDGWRRTGGGSSEVGWGKFAMYLWRPRLETEALLRSLGIYFRRVLSLAKHAKVRSPIHQTPLMAIRVSHKQ